MRLLIDDHGNYIWGKTGDVVEKYLLTFLTHTPYYIMAGSLVLMAGVYLEFLILYMFMHTILFLQLYNEKDDKYKRPIAGAVGLAQEELERAKKENVVPETIYYIANYGTAIKDFKGRSEAESKKLSLHPDNVLYEFLVTKDKYMEHTLIGGSTGSGKTIAITSAYIEPLIKIGGGFIYLECKGDMPITHGVLSLAAEYGREDDVYVLDFSGGASKYTHSLAPLKNGDANVLVEALTNMIKIMEGENSWVSDKAILFMGVLLFPLVIMRDLDIFINAKDLANINADNWEEDFKKVGTIDFNFEALKGYVNFQSAINLFYKFRELFQTKSFIKRLSEHHNYKQASKLYESYLLPLEQFLTNYGIDIEDQLNVPKYFDVTSPEQRKENNYAIDSWSMAFHIFGNEAIFGSLVNKRYPDIDFLDVMRNNKMVVVSLPSLQNSRDKNEKIGKFITSLMKAAIGEMLNKIAAEGKVSDQEIGKRFRPFKLPFMLLNDEISNIGNEMMGSMASMIRSIGSGGGGMGMLFAGQSEGDLKRIGSGEYDGEQIKANIAIKYFLNLSDKYYKETAAELCGEQEWGEISEKVLVHQNKDSEVSESMTKVKHPRFKKEDFSQKLKKKTGEGILVQDGFNFPEKFICRYVEAKPATEFKLMRNISHEELINSFDIEGYEDINNNESEVLDAA